MNKKDTETSVEIEKLDLRSHEIAADKAAELLRLFPEVRTEGGKVDFDRLKRVLGETADPGKERYGMNWPGKADCFKTIQQPSLATLRPCPEESVNFDATENLIIEGDNLEVLKLLQKSYIGKIKLIYIDPPYNTGNDFIYPDNYSESLQTYLEYSNQVDDQGKKFSTNADTDGRFHSKWLNMMYPRLYLARNLLREDGVIFISIDDHEVDNLKKMCCEVFGEENFRANVVWRRTVSGAVSGQGFAVAHDHILCFSKMPDSPLGRLPVDDEADYKNPDNDPRGPYKLQKLERTLEGARPTMTFEIQTPSGPITKTWAVSLAKFQELKSDNRIAFSRSGAPYYKQFLSEYKGRLPDTWWDEIGGYNQDASRELKGLFGEKDVFNNPKPVDLLCTILQIGSGEDSIVLDYFSGSGTTAHAVLQQNKVDLGNRKFILVQLPEPTGRSDYKTIADITKERVRRAVKKLNELDSDKLPGTENIKSDDRGFKVFKLAESNFKPWQAEVPTGDTETLAKQLEFHASHIREGRTPDDILYEILIKSGFPLPTHVEKITLCGKSVYSIADGAMLICLDDALTHELIKAMADRKPERVICLDEGFAGNDQLKTNAVQTMKARGVTSFKTI